MRSAPARGAARPREVRLWVNRGTRQAKERFAGPADLRSARASHGGDNNRLIIRVKWLNIAGCGLIIQAYCLMSGAARTWRQPCGNCANVGPGLGLGGSAGGFGW